MPQVDPVILELHAKLDRYETRLKNAERVAANSMSNMGASAKRLERDMMRSSGAIGSTLKGLATSFAAYFSGRELIALADSYTRLQNSLRVAGLEGEKLASVQQKLLGFSQQYGVGIEELANLYGKTAQTQSDLNATTAEMLKVTQATAQALKITGTSTVQAQGAMLGLSQALASGIVRAEEFNQINEGGLRPLLQVAANTDRFGGSVAQLRKAIVDGKVSSEEFFRAILGGAAELETKAGKATLTVAGGFNALVSSLTVYFGEADKSNGVSVALGEAMGFLADNLDTIIPALAIVATAIGVNYVRAAVAGAGASVLMGNAVFAMQARMLGAATTAEALTFALGGLRGALATAAILAFGAALYYVADQALGAQDATEEYTRKVDVASKAADKASDIALKLATARGKERDATLRAAEAEVTYARKAIASAKADVQAARASLAKARARVTDLQTNTDALARGGSEEGALGSLFAETFATGSASRAKSNLDAAQTALGKQEDRLKTLEDAIGGGVDLSGVASSGSGAGKAKGAGKGAGGASGPSLAEIEDRFQAERNQLGQQALSAMAATARSAEERAEYELRGVELARLRTVADIKANKDYSEAQKAVLLEQVARLAEIEREGIEFARKREQEQDAQRLADERYRAEQDALQIQYDLADTQEERKRLALAILDLQERQQTAMLQSIIASETAADADKQRAQLALDALRQLSPANRERTARQNETRSEAYLRNLRKSPEQINEAIDDIRIDGLEALNDGLVDAITGVRSLGDVFKNVARQIIADLLRIAIQRTIVSSLANVLGLGAPSIGSSASGAPFVKLGGKKAIGGPVRAGAAYLVGEQGPEVIQMGSRSGLVVPNSKIGANSRGVQQSITIKVDAKGALLAGQVEAMVRQGMQAAAQVATAAGASEAERRISDRQRRRLA